MRIGAGGAVLVAADRVITTAADAPIARLGQIATAIGRAADAHAPQIACVERVFANPNAKTSLALGEARGAIIAALLARQVAVFELSALQIKKSIAGYGRADKIQIAAMVRRFLRLEESAEYPHDVTDALACALAAERAFVGRDGAAATGATRSGRRWRELPPALRARARAEGSP